LDSKKGRKWWQNGLETVLLDTDVRMRDKKIR